VMPVDMQMIAPAAARTTYPGRVNQAAKRSEACFWIVEIDVGKVHGPPLVLGERVASSNRRNRLRRPKADTDLENFLFSSQRIGKSREKRTKSNAKGEKTKQE